MLSLEGWVLKFHWKDKKIQQDGPWASLCLFLALHIRLSNVLKYNRCSNFSQLLLFIYLFDNTSKTWRKTGKPSKTKLLWPSWNQDLWVSEAWLLYFQFYTLLSPLVNILSYGCCIIFMARLQLVMIRSWSDLMPLQMNLNQAVWSVGWIVW